MSALDELLGGLPAPVERCPFDEGASNRPRFDSCGKCPPEGDCHTHYRGSQAHCTACHLTFGSDTAFDGHRYGEHGVSRTCRTTDELAAMGWGFHDGDHLPEGRLIGVWRTPGRED